MGKKRKPVTRQTANRSSSAYLHAERMRNLGFVVVDEKITMSNRRDINEYRSANTNVRKVGK